MVWWVIPGCTKCIITIVILSYISRKECTPGCEDLMIMSRMGPVVAVLGGVYSYIYGLSRVVSATIFVTCTLDLKVVYVQRYMCLYALRYNVVLHIIILYYVPLLHGRSWVSRLPPRRPSNYLVYGNTISVCAIFLPAICVAYKWLYIITHACRVRF